MSERSLNCFLQLLLQPLSPWHGVIKVSQKAWRSECQVETLDPGPSRGQACKSQPLMASGHRPASLHLLTRGHRQSCCSAPPDPPCPFGKHPSAELVSLFLIQIVPRAGWRRPRPHPCAFAQGGNGQRRFQLVTAVTTSLRPCLPHPGSQQFPRSDHGWPWRVEYYLRKSTCLPTCPPLELYSIQL